ELAPNFAGTLTGISNTLATIPGFLAPVITGAIINNQWLVFMMTGVGVWTS
ncbi:hypothetical protein SK128_010643, partial [Halocaridina rubra]